MWRAIILSAVLPVGLCTGALAQDAAPKATVVHRMSCTLVRFYVAKYTLPTAEAYARSSGASEAEIETARHCISVQTAQK
jgi:hypothetical protein